MDNVVGMGQANDMASNVLEGEKMKQKKKNEKEFQRVKKRQGKKKKKEKELQNKNTLETLLKEVFDFFWQITYKQKLKGWSLRKLCLIVRWLSIPLLPVLQGDCAW